MNNYLTNSSLQNIRSYLVLYLTIYSIIYIQYLVFNLLNTYNLIIPEGISLDVYIYIIIYIYIYIYIYI